jgi:hypothetical protein
MTKPNKYIYWYNYFYQLSKNNDIVFINPSILNIIRVTGRRERSEAPTADSNQ